MTEVNIQNKLTLEHEDGEVNQVTGDLQELVERAHNILSARRVTIRNEEPTAKVTLSVIRDEEFSLSEEDHHKLSEIARYGRKYGITVLFLSSPDE